jgi:hypothetical protein
MPGATRVYSSNSSGIVSSAFVNPDGSKILVLFNSTRGRQKTSVVWGDRSFSYTLPGWSGATFRWQGVQTGGTELPLKGRVLQTSSFHDTMGLQSEPTSDTRGGYNLGYADDGDWARYEGVDFDAGMTRVSARVASASAGGRVELRLDSPAGPLLGVITVPPTGGWQRWRTVRATLAAGVGQGVHDLYVVFRGSTYVGNLNWLKFL